jgi:hypothetical protein
LPIKLRENSVLMKIYINVKVLFYSPTDAKVNCLKNNLKIYIKVYVKTAPTCFGAITIIREPTIRIVRSLMMVIALKHVGAVLMSILM